MKQLIIIAIALASTNAFATRARVTALGNSPHLIDTQTVYSNPADMMVMGDYVNFESGTTAAGAEGANTEGMITRSMGDAKMGLSLGHLSKNAALWGLRNATLTGIATSKAQQNPVELSYGMKSGDMSWAGTFVYSNFKDKTATDESESSMGLRAGLRMGALDAKLGLGLGNEYSHATNGKFKGTLGLTLGAGYWMDTMYFSGVVTMAGFKTESTAGVEQRKYDNTDIMLSVVNSHKKEGNLEGLFYGVGLSNVSSKLTVLSTTDIKTTTMNLPIWIGMETEANSWMTLRGSVSQDIILSNTKVETSPTANPATDKELAPGDNTTKVSVGAGLKFNKVTLDGTIVALTTGGNGTPGAANQQLDGNQLLTKVGMTYMF
jgi:hypothetical protein